MEADIPTLWTYSFYVLVTWGLSALLVGFRVVVDDERTGLILRGIALAWLGIPALLASMGVLADFDAVPPLLPRLIAPMALFLVAFVFSPWGSFTAGRLPFSLLVGTQLFRLPLEILLYGLSTRGELPVEMTMRGYNFDVITGLSAGVLWYFLRRGAVSRAMLLVWNVFGIVCLGTVVTIAVLSFPQPFGWFTPENRIVAYYPWVWLPTFLVQLALVCHLLVFRKLWLLRHADADEPIR